MASTLPPNTSQYPTIGRKSNLNPTPVKFVDLSSCHHIGAKPHCATYRWEGKVFFFAWDRRATGVACNQIDFG